MNHCTPDGDFRQINSAIENLRRDEGLPFEHLLDVAAIREALQRAGVAFRDRVYNPVVTLWAFLSQVVSDDHSCADAVARVNAHRVAQGERPASPNTTSYCGARRRLPLTVIRELATGSGQQLERQANKAWLWHERPVKIVDGSTAIMPDTVQNQAAFPQPSSQKPGLGFPMVRLVAVFSLACGAILELALGRCDGKQTGENNLFRQVFHALNSGDICLGDSLFDCYRNVADLRARGVDCVFRKNGSRCCDFRRGQRLGQDDHLVVWKRPKFDRTRFDRETYDALPAEMEMRELRFQVHQKGFRTKTVYVVTTLTDAAAHPSEDIAALYRERWHSELDLRSLKRVLQMGELRCKTPAMVVKEIWTHVLAYNLIRREMAEAAQEHGLQPRRLSFKGAKQVLTHYTPRLATADPQRQADIHRAMLWAMAQKQVGDRPDRVEPRKIKKRKSKYSPLTKPRRALTPAATAA